MEDITITCISLVNRYLTGNMTIAHLISKYFDIYFNNNSDLPDSEFFVLDEIFACLDGYTTDISLLNRNPDYYLDEKELKICLEKAVQKIPS